MKIKYLVRDLTHNEIKERKWRRVKIWINRKEHKLPEYIVSDYGEIMRIVSGVNKTSTYPGRILNGKKITGGYFSVVLYSPSILINGAKGFLKHRVVFLVMAWKDS